MNTDDCEALTELLFPHMSGSGLSKDTVGYDMAQYEASRLARIVVAAGWRPPKPHIHDWHQTENYTWCQCGATARQHYGVWVVMDAGANRA